MPHPTAENTLSVLKRSVKKKRGKRFTSLLLRIIRRNRDEDFLFCGIEDNDKCRYDLGIPALSYS